MKKILINFLYWSTRETGLYRVGYNIVKNLAKISNDKLFCITNYYSDFRVDNLKVIPKDFISKRAVFQTIEAQFYLLTIIKKIKPDIIFNPFHYGIIFRKTNQISIINDLINLTVFKARLISHFYHRFILRKLIQNCKFIIVPSNATKNDLINFFKVNENKIKVIYFGIEEKFKNLNLTKENFFLVVNPTFPYKNIHYIIKNWKKFDIKSNLIIAGCNTKYVKYYYRLKNIVKTLNFENRIIFYERVSDGELIKLYNQAKALISASLKEGFNLPPLEALACGTPVILSDIPIHREIYGDIGIFFDLNNDESFLNALNQVEKINYEDFEKKRLEFIKRFSWQKTAEEIYKIIRECIEG